MIGAERGIGTSIFGFRADRSLGHEPFYFSSAVMVEGCKGLESEIPAKSSTLGEPK